MINSVAPTVPKIGHTVDVPTKRRRLLAPTSLRTRVTLFFSIAGLLTSTALAVVTYLIARNYLVQQREQSAVKQALSNTLAVSNRITSDTTDFSAVISKIPTEGNGLLFVKNPDRFFAQGNFTQQQLPPDVADLVLGHTGSGYQIHQIGRDSYFVVGVSIPGAKAAYFEAFSLNGVGKNLQLIATALAIGAITTTFFGAAVGWWASRRLLRPVSRVAKAAGEIAGGGLDTRLPPESDRELNRLATSFNNMADAVQTRIQREARFSSDVSHELRSPITALTAAVEVLDARRADLPGRTQQALDVVVSQVRRFDQMVLDLLELSRLDAGVTDNHREAVNLPDLIKRIGQRYGFGTVPIEVAPRAATVVNVDKRRVERIIANLLDNAKQHGGGPVRILIEPSRINLAAAVNVVVEDDGPGVALGERTRIFERFARGTASRGRVGTGLGLALVSEHAQSHGGSAWVEDRSEGGSRFIVSLPVGDV
jgi:two-component system, OmpR family, sensor histidine kinase MtrB